MGRKVRYYTGDYKAAKRNAGKGIILIDTSFSPRNYGKLNPRTGKISRAKTVSRGKYWVEFKSIQNMNNTQIAYREGALYKIATGRDISRQIAHEFVRGGSASMLRRSKRFNQAAQGIKGDVQILLHMKSKGSSRNPNYYTFLRDDKQLGRDYGFRGLRKSTGTTGKQDWMAKNRESLAAYSGIRNADIRAIVKAYGSGVVPQKVRETGIWWFDKKLRGGRYERRLNPELEKYLNAKKKLRALQKREYRRRKDPLVGTRPRGGTFRTREHLGFMHDWKPSEAFLKAHAQSRFLNYERGTESAMFMKNFGLKLVGRLRGAIDSVVIEAQEQLMREIEGVKAWHNLTGNAYTGIVSAAYVSSRSVRNSHFRQMPGVRGRKATMGKLSKGNHPHRYVSRNGTRERLNHSRAKVFIGRRFDDPENYFFIKDTGQFETTTKGYAYKEALDLLTKFNPSQEYRQKGIIAAIKVATGTPEYIDRLKTTHGSSIMLFAMQRAEEILLQKINAFVEKQNSR